MSFYVWFGSFELHNLSRLTPLYAVVVVGLTAWALLRRMGATMSAERMTIIGATLAVALYVLLIDFAREAAIPNMGNIVRFLTPFIGLIIICSNRFEERQLRTISAIFLAVVLLAALSIFYQVLYGPIQWFADSSERAGVQRYASLLGSLTTFGTAAPIALLVAARYVRISTVFCIIAAVLLVAAIMSLQKAALGGLIVVLPFIVALLARRTMFLGAFGLAVLLLIASMLLPAGFADYLEVGWRYFTDRDFSTQDVTFSESVLSRLTEYPAELVEHHGIGSLGLGVGLRGGSGIFGYDQEPMAHNAIMDYLAIGGVVFLAYAGWIIGRMLFTMIALPKLVRCGVLATQDATFVAGLGILYLVNLPFSSGVEYHPSTCWIPGIIIAYQLSIIDRWRDRFAIPMDASIGAETAVS
jgi:hypothetical protein